MQKERAQPNSQKSPELSFTEESYPPIQDLSINQRTVSLAETFDEGEAKVRCDQFQHDFLKTKRIDKKHNHQQRPDMKKKHNYQRKVQKLQHKINQLQKQLSSLRRKQQRCPQCHYNLNQTQQSLSDLIPQCYTTPCPYIPFQRSHSRQSVQFQKINFMSPLMMSQQMQQKSWIFIGTIMIAMGSKIIQFDGSLNVFKVVKQAVDRIRRQVQKSQPNISMDFYLAKQQFVDSEPNQITQGFDFDPFFAKNQQSISGFQLESVKLQSVEHYQLIYDCKYQFNVKYQALITVMEYLRQHCSIG